MGAATTGDGREDHPRLEKKMTFIPKNDCLNDQGGTQIDISKGKAATLRAQDHGHPPLILDDRKIRIYGISAYDSNSMKSSNPHSGIYVATTSRCLDLNGGNPACNQGGILILTRTKRI